MPANRVLGNPTARDETGGLRNHERYGSRTEASWETNGYATGPYGAHAPHFYPNPIAWVSVKPNRKPARDRPDAMG